MLDYDAVRSIVEPVATALPGRTLVNLTADTPDRARQMADWAGRHGIDYLDGSIMTPVASIGGPNALVLYSGAGDVFAAHQSSLASIGGRAVHLGPDPGRAAAYDVALLDLFWTTMSGYVHALALARSQGITARELAPYARGIVDILPDVINEFAGYVDEARYPGDDSNLASAAAGMAHVVHAAEAEGIDAGVLTAALAVARRAIAAGHGTDGFARLVDTLSSTG